jgi:capsular exopolysaccharide synthesis family protein
MNTTDQPFHAHGGEAGSGARLFDVLRRRWEIIVGVVLVCVAAAIVTHERAAKSYSATASVAFQEGTLSEAALGVAAGGGAEPQRGANTEVLTAHSSEVALAVRNQLGLQASPDELLSDVTVETAPSANVLNVVAKTPHPQQAAQLANAFAQQYIAFRARSQLAGIEASQSRITRQMEALPASSPERAALNQTLQRLNALRAVAGGGATIIGLAAVPGSPSGMGLGTAIAIGLLIGLALALAIVFLLESLDRRVKTLDEFEREYRLPALTAIPQTAFGSGSANQRTDLLEPHRILRTALDFAAVTRELDTILVTSAIAGEGKTTVAVDLAHAIALAGRSVALVELDLRHPTFARQFGVKTREGLTVALTRGSDVEDQLVEPLPNLPNLSVLFSGPLPPNPAELLSSPKIAEIIAALARERDTVIIDSPPLNPVADSQMLLDNPAIHAVLLVARAGKTTREAARRARAILERHMVEPIGLAVTGLRDAGRYGYESYYVSPPAKAAASGKPTRREPVADAEPGATAASTRVSPAQQH